MTFALVIGASFALLAIVLGAFGAHALKDKFPEPRYAAIWETAVQYHMYHALGLVAVGILGFDVILGTTSVLQWASYLMVGGILLFSGSLYVLAVTGVKKLGAITPLGGLLFIGAWACVIIAVI
ncbi:DUF423 domain-containing protein [Metasolibacillus sp. FSL H7-0170]|uniref:DUF423 domain-containing protein n=1 Tax=Metasolibacillus TaxID=2703677 RepID=UPI00079BC734|nr:DUF423 domain-containing protein [Metasolibacillus fluoroglycofenilyticus]KYG88890.1 hypothetical protein A0U40_14410 [[Bacillus] sp. KCTC 13219]